MNEDYKKLAEMIDGCMRRGTGHVNVTVGEEDSITDKNTGCIEGGACSAPTLHKGIDD